jgi:hypothetical protein
LAAVVLGLTMISCESQSANPQDELASCRRRTEDAKVEEMFYSMEVAKCMETRGFVQIDSKRGLLNAENWKKK